MPQESPFVQRRGHGLEGGRKAPDSEVRKREARTGRASLHAMMMRDGWGSHSTLLFLTFGLKSAASQVELIGSALVELYNCH